jgi:lipid-A-disaccharide synthase-like uncharacterized protein
MRIQINRSVKTIFYGLALLAITLVLHFTLLKPDPVHVMTYGPYIDLREVVLFVFSEGLIIFGLFKFFRVK